ncbi:hypothetical protein AB0E63_26285 [Kribbella sp. NPDC026596]|uniref:hypothetical protein n=1 Tax=Kribbella sp. NPDC026596 TaxID=3155122 RepID=UPI003402FB26
MSRVGRAALDLVEAGDVRIDVTDVLPLSDAKLALDRLATATTRAASSSSPSTEVQAS